MVLVFVTSTIELIENREVVTINIPGALLHATNKDYIVMPMNGTLAKLMAKTDPNLYRKYLVDKKGKKVLYLRLQKECVTLLPKVGIRAYINGLRCQPI
jgi:hypothetical protein